MEKTKPTLRELIEELTEHAERMERGYNEDPWNWEKLAEFARKLSLVEGEQEDLQGEYYEDGYAEGNKDAMRELAKEKEASYSEGFDDGKQAGEGDVW